MINSKPFNTVLLLTIIGEFLLPWILKHFYPGYDSKMMVMSALGSPESPVRIIYNIWLIWLGCFLSFTATVYYSAYKENYHFLSIIMMLSVLLFAVGAGLLSGIFSVNESKDVVTVASKIHGAGAAVGFMALLFFPLLCSVIAFRQTDRLFGFVCLFAFLLAFVCFACFIMGDKEEFAKTVLGYEGLWERLTLFFMYVPFVYKAAKIVIQ